MRRGALVTTQWLAPRLSAVQCVDATWFLPPLHGPRSAEAEFLQARIPGSVRFDLDALSDPAEKHLPHMLAPPDWFASKLEDLGLFSQRPIVVYDRLGMFSAPRAWWNMKIMGAKDVVLLDGGLPAWLENRLPFASGIPPPVERPGKWIVDKTLYLKHVVPLQEVEAMVKTPNRNVVIVDARPAARFYGEQPEPRPGLRSGAIPHSLNLPFTNLLNEDGTYKSDEELKQAFRSAGVLLDAGPLRPHKVVCTCGSATTAAVVSFALSNFFGIDAPLYDGSFTEWAKVDHPERPVIKPSKM